MSAARGVPVDVRRGRRVVRLWLDDVVVGEGGTRVAVVDAGGCALPPALAVLRAAAAARAAGCARLLVRCGAATLTVDLEPLAESLGERLEEALRAGETVWDFAEPAPGGLWLPRTTASSVVPPLPAEGYWHRGLRRPRVARAGAPVAVVVGGPAGGSAPVLHYTTDGSLPAPDAPATRTVPFAPADQGPGLWRAQLPPQPAGTRVRYRVRLPGGGWLEEGVPVDGDGRPVPHLGPCHAFLVEPDPPPAWAADAVIYHAFVDRFARPGGWGLGGGDFPLPEPALYDFVGGTLAGVRERLDHVAGLGCTALWLSPVYRGTAYHGYHVTDLRDVDPRFGSVAELRALVRDAHARGLRVILDFVPNHVGHLHPDFLRAQADPAAPERRKFLFTRWPDRYATFMGVRELPKLHNDDPATRAETIAAALFWLKEVGADGLRLDHANGLSHDAWVEFRQAVKKACPEALLLGEVWDDPALWLPYAGELDAVFDFATVFALRDALATGAKPLHELEEDLAYLDRLFAGVPLLLCRFLDNHDLDRFLVAAGGDVTALRLAAAVLYALTGPVSLYYGTEVGLGQRAPCLDPETGWMRFEFAREPFPWWRWDAGDRGMRALYAYFARLGALRRAHPALGRGRRLPVRAEGDLLAFWKVLPPQPPVLVAVNRGMRPAVLEAEVPGAGGRRLIVDLGPRDAVWVTADGSVLLRAADA